MAGFMDPQRRRTFIAYFLFSAIILVFIFWGYKQNDNPNAVGYAATVNNTVISVGDFRRALDRQMEFYSKIFGKQMDLGGQRSLQIRNSTLERLISQELLVQGAHNEGIWASDAQVRQQIFDIPAFQKDGRFMREAYDNYLRYMNMSPGQFETDLRKDLVLQDLREVFETATKPTTLEVDKEINSRSTKVNLDYAVFDSDQAEQRIKVSDAEVGAFLKTPDASKKIEDYYTFHKSDYVKEGEIHARHILIKAPEGDKAADEAALKKIQSIQERLKKEPFEKVAKETSEDPGSKDKGGDLGYFAKGRMVPAFEKAAFSLEKGQVSMPIRTAYGYHLIQVLDKKGAESTTIEQARKDIAKKLVAKEKATVWQSEIEKELAAQDGPEKVSKINKLVAEVNLKWEATGNFDAGSSSIPKIGPAEELTEKAFSLTPAKPFVTKLIREGNKAYVVKLKDFTTDKVEAKPTDTADQIARGRAQDALGSWEKTLSENARIHRNLDLVTERQN